MKFLNLGVLILVTMKMVTVSRILILRPDLLHTNPSFEANLVSESKSEKQFRRVFRGGDCEMALSFDAEPSMKN